MKTERREGGRRRRKRKERGRKGGREVGERKGGKEGRQEKGVMIFQFGSLLPKATGVPSGRRKCP